GANQELIEPYVFNHTKVRVVYNKNYKLGQTSSVQAAVAALNDEADGFMLFPVDCPWIAKSTVQELLKDFERNRPEILIPVYQGHRGHLPLFNISLKPEILNFSANQGLNSLFAQKSPALLEIKDPGILKTFNTPQELQKLIG